MAKFDALTAAAVLELLQRHEAGLPLPELARRINTSVDTTRKLIDYLWTLGIPDPDGFEDPYTMFDFDYDDYERDHIRLTHSPVATFELQLSPIERTTALLGLLQLQPFTDFTQHESITQLVHKLDPALNLQPDSAVTAEVSAITAAIARGHQLRLQYRAESSNRLTERSVDPLRIEARDRYVYLNAWCNWRNEQRWFRVDRIVSLTELEKPIAQHSKRVRETPLVVNSSQLIDVEFAATPLGLEILAPYTVSSTRAHAAADGRSHLVVGMRNPQLVTRLVCENSGELEVLGPADIRRAVFEAVTELLASEAFDTGMPLAPSGHTRVD
ncbi:WYL domain-containing protein [uncultured Gulosibacter sp.]|uniref:helix-turn-helix transcriptional regulator n=1 Tax=uncultured Gulosibacter sp. TaxID=1339167 RepID=UPI00288A5555|nr:WYL domain-containing protein [uncultured Gulosibacter sp.]